MTLPGIYKNRGILVNVKSIVIRKLVPSPVKPLMTFHLQITFTHPAKKIYIYMYIFQMEPEYSHYWYKFNIDEASLFPDRIQEYKWCQYKYWRNVLYVLQIEPQSIAGKDGRIHEGDQILQVSQIFPYFEIHTTTEISTLVLISIGKHRCWLAFWYHFSTLRWHVCLKYFLQESRHQ